MPVQYSSTSPYYKTSMHGNYMDVMTARYIPKMRDDVVFRINPTYRHRPDLLAHDLYGDTGLWWVFAVRNPNVIKDPIFDFVPGVQIYLPKKSTLTTALG